ncbi:hypothetical protein G4228_011102 [Cervus hanglu yarkandensis]|nr:hypothetical protein G4228_011102 [Cervus hanglu yarkandensis]
MALLWALTVLSLLPLLDAQSPECANLMTVAPITNATLDWLTGKWFYIGSAFRNPEYNESARMIQAAFFYFEPRHAEDKLIVRDYQTIADKCIYNRSTINIYRQNGTMSKIADKPEVTQEQKKEFLDVIKCIGIQESEITYSDEKKDVCGPLEKQHQEERKKETEAS